jgi:flagellar M-ring protein FliF
MDMARSFAWPVAGLIFAFLVMQMLIKPAIKTINAPPPPPPEVQVGQLNAVVSDENQRPDMLALGGGASGSSGVVLGPDGNPLPVALTDHQLRLEEARALTRSNPVAVANIVKTWVNGEVPA